MAELGRRLRLAVSLGEAELGDKSVQMPVAEASRAEPASQGAARGRIAADPEPARPAVVPAADESAAAPISPHGGGSNQSEPVVVDQLPSAEELAERLPAEVRTVLEELFRAKWTGVKRLRTEDLRN
jgi:hypothetical protein